MEIRLLDHVVYASYDELTMDEAVVGRIAENTAETWQPDRRTEEKGSNTRQGKVAEEIVERFLAAYFPARIGLMTYDEIRNDDFKKHAPFDFLLWEGRERDLEPIVDSIRRDISNTPDRFVKLSARTRQLCREADVKIAEVKSTRIRDRLKGEADFRGDYEDEAAVKRLVGAIKQADDVFCYPCYKRSEASESYTFSDYCRYVKELLSLPTGMEGERLRERVLEIERERQCCDLFVRVYLDPCVKKGFVIGWMQREQLLDHAVRLKRMRQEGKSERALYFAKSLTEVHGMDGLLRVFENGTRIYANPYTKTCFYHRSADCKYLNRVNRDELIVFEGEDEALEDGRYTKRCYFCF